MVESNAIEAVLEREHPLDFVCLDHRGQDVAHGERRLARGNRITRQPVGGRENAAEVVRWMTPLGRQPRVVEVEPADHRADVERGLHRIELIRRARHLGAVRDDGSRDDRSHQLGASGVTERLEAAAERIEQTIARGFVRFFAVDAITRHVIGDVDQHLIGLWTNRGGCFGHDEFSSNALIDRHERAVVGAGVIGGWTDDLAVDPLFDHMRRPP